MNSDFITLKDIFVLTIQVALLIEVEENGEKL